MSLVYFMLRFNSISTGCWASIRKARSTSTTGQTWDTALPPWRSTERKWWVGSLWLCPRLTTWLPACWISASSTPSRWEWTRPTSRWVNIVISWSRYVLILRIPTAGAALSDMNCAYFYARAEFVLRTKYVIYCMYNFLCSCCATACSWWSPACTPKSSPPRPTSPWINSCAPCPWLSLRNTVELSRSVARDHVTHGAKWNNKLHTAQTWYYRVLYVSSSVFTWNSIKLTCIYPFTLYGRVHL